MNKLLGWLTLANCVLGVCAFSVAMLVDGNGCLPGLNEITSVLVGWMVFLSALVAAVVLLVLCAGWKTRLLVSALILIYAYMVWGLLTYSVVRLRQEELLEKRGHDTHVSLTGV